MSGQPPAVRATPRSTHHARRRYTAPPAPRPTPDAATRVTGEAHDVVHVQLRHHVAERRDVELVPAEVRHQRAPQQRRFRPETCQVGRREVVDLAQSGPARHQDQPRVVPVPHQQHTAQRQVTHHRAIGRERRMQLEVFLVPRRHGATSIISLGRRHICAATGAQRAATISGTAHLGMNAGLRSMARGPFGIPYARGCALPAWRRPIRLYAARPEP